jgi:hypothetical protein
VHQFLEMRKSLSENLEMEPISSTPEIRPMKEKATADALLLELAKRGSGSRKYRVPKPAGWTDDEIALLGTRTDAEIAKRIGRTVEAVRACRNALGIPPSGPLLGRWDPAELELLGTAPDYEIAKVLERKVSAVTQKRRKLHIPTFDSDFRKWTAEEDRSSVRCRTRLWRKN